MRIPRTILLGLSPLLSLWAMGAQLAGAPSPLAAQSAEQHLTADALQQFIQPVVSFLLLAAEQASGQVTRGHRAPRLSPGAGRHSSPCVHLAGAG